MSKTGVELRHDAKERMKKYRREMTAKGFISTTIFLSNEHRTELKRLGQEHRLTRAEAAEHIFKTYLDSDPVNKDITRTHNTNTESQAETRTTIEVLEARIHALEKKGSNQAEKTEASVLNKMHDLNLPVKKVIGCGDGMHLVVIGKNKTRPEVEPDQGLPDYLIDVDPNMPIGERDKIVLRLREDFPKGKGITKKIIEMLNDAGILLEDKPWETTKQFTDQLACIRRRAKKWAGNPNIPKGGTTTAGCHKQTGGDDRG